jgi:peptidoglycan/LPS O-acetylase OafA/YrhL
MDKVQQWWSQGYTATAVSGDEMPPPVGSPKLRAKPLDAEHGPETGLLASEKTAPRQASRLSRWGWLLLPSFVARCYGHSDYRPPKPNATSYLNGLKGLVSLIVLNRHTTNDYYWHVNLAYGSGPNETHVVQMPFLRLVVSGELVVTIFFVLSGFALAFGPLKKSYTQGAEGVRSALAAIPGNVVRRPVRLFLPALPIFLVTPFFVYAHLWYADNRTELQDPKESLWAEFSASLRDWVRLSWNPLDWADFRSMYAPQTWALGPMFRGSYIVFFATSCLLGVKPYTRMALMLALTLDAMYNAPERYGIALNLYGFLLADMRHMRATLRDLSPPLRNLRTFAMYFLLILGLFFGCWPPSDYARGTWYSYWSTWSSFGNEPKWYWPSIGAVFIVTAMEYLPETQSPFNHPVMLYLGDISFSIYLCHWAVLNTAGKGTVNTLRRAFGMDDYLAFLCGLFTTYALSIWVADVHFRVIDQACGPYAKWVAEKLGV